MKSLIEIRKQQRSKSDPSKVLGEFEIEGNNIRQVIELSENYRSSGGYRLLGLVHLHTPKIPFLFDWVSREYSKELLIKAVKRSPEHLGNLFALAKIYDKLGDKEKCDRLLNTIINTPPRKFMLMEDELIREKARKMMGLTEYTLTALKTKNNEK